MADAQIRAVITAQDNASGVLSSFSSAGQISFGKLTAAFATGQAVFEAVQGAIEGVADVIGDVISKAESYQNAESGLQNALQNNTDLTDKSTTSLTKNADAMSNLTAFTEQQYVASDDLLAVHKLTQDQIINLTPHIADFAQGIADATGEMPNLVGATQLVAKAIGENDASGLSASLKRAGIALTDNQMEILKSGNMSQKLATITDILSGKFQGLSTADTASIKMGILTNQVDKAQEKIGMALLPTISSLADKLAKFVESDKFQVWLSSATNWLAIELPKALNWMINTGIPGLKRAFDDLKPVLEIISFEFGTIGTAISLIKEGINWLTQHKTDIGSIIKTAVLPPGVQQVLHTLHVPGFANGVANFSGGLAVVGERGPEIVNLPPGSDVIPNGGGMGQTTININLNAQAFMGSQVEARKYAQSIVDNIKDIAARKNMNGADYLAAARGMV